MRRLSIFAAALAAAAVFPGAANAITCYTVLDRSDNTIYQDTQPPVDMSETGAADREAMRARKDFLTVSDTDKCPQVTAPLGATGYRAASVEEIVLYEQFVVYGFRARIQCSLLLKRPKLAVLIGHRRLARRDGM